MSDIKEKIEQKTEALNDLCQKMTDRLEEYLGSGLEDADAEEVGLVIDMIKDLAEAKEKTVKSMYYCQILEAMEESEHDKMHYTRKMETDPGYEASRYDVAKRDYEEAMEMHAGAGEMDMEARVKKLDEYLKSVMDDMKLIIPKLEGPEKMIFKSRLQELQSNVI